MSSSIPTLQTFAIWVFFAGACVGSFLNVCIFRIPEGKSVVSPGSHCPNCKNAIPFYLNIPILSFLILRGRCRHCGQAISFRYPMVEFLTATLTLGLFYKFGPTASFVFWFIFSSTLVTITFIDIDHQIIPDRISLPGIILCSLSFLLLPEMTFQKALLGVLFGGGIPWALAAGYYWIRGQQGLGGGDIKLLAMIGAATGPSGVLFTLFVASITGTVFGLASAVGHKEKSQLKIPFGPFLSFGALLYLFFGQKIILWYFNFIG